MTIPSEMLQRHIAVLGTNGSGKTAAAKSQIVEPVLASGGRVVVIDPTGVWWGLRLRPDGKPSPFRPYIFGGDHGDMPLREIDAKPLAEAFGTSSDSAVFDTSLMTVADRSRFFTEFANTIFRKNKGPLNLVIDEAHLFMPQAGASIGGLVPAMLHAGNNLVSLGRSRGLRVTMITQRPAKLHKDSLTQAQSLIAMRVIAPQDRKAITEWLAEYDTEKRGSEVLGTLSGFQAGEAWVWAPLLHKLERMRFPLPTTFDSSAAPDSSEAGAMNLPALDLGNLKTHLASLAAHVEANDPAKLRAEIARLQRAAKVEPVIDRQEVNKARQEGFDAGMVKGYGQGFNDAQRLAAEALAGVKMPTGPASILAPPPVHEAPALRAATAVEKPTQEPITVPTRQIADRRPIQFPSLSAPQAKVMLSIMFWASMGQMQPSKEQVAAIAGYSPGSGGFGNLLGGLKTLGVISYPRPGHIAATETAGFHDAILIDEAAQILRGRLSGPQVKVLNAALSAKELSKEKVAQLSGYSAGSGGFGNLLGQLRTLDILTYPAPGRVAVTEWARQVLQ